MLITNTKHNRPDVFNANDGYYTNNNNNNWEKKRRANKKKMLGEQKKKLRQHQMKCQLKRRPNDIQMNNSKYNNDTADTHYTLIWPFKFSWFTMGKSVGPNARQHNTRNNNNNNNKSEKHFTNDCSFCDNFVEWRLSISLLSLVDFSICIESFSFVLFPTFAAARNSKQCSVDRLQKVLTSKWHRNNQAKEVPYFFLSSLPKLKHIRLFGFNLYRNQSHGMEHETLSNKIHIKTFSLFRINASLECVRLWWLLLRFYENGVKGRKKCQNASQLILNSDLFAFFFLYLTWSLIHQLVTEENS